MASPSPDDGGKKLHRCHVILGLPERLSSRSSVLPLGSNIINLFRVVPVRLIKVKMEIIHHKYISSSIKYLFIIIMCECEYELLTIHCDQCKDEQPVCDLLSNERGGTID